ncbi:hypothetical protein BTHA_1771 [Burkholderia thailandensis MSMB59]|nr:hypothetical protein BTHA_1771 [Burkholderia thailandensis MSMB59]
MHPCTTSTQLQRHSGIRICAAVRHATVFGFFHSRAAIETLRLTYRRPTFGACRFARPHTKQADTAPPGSAERNAHSNGFQRKRSHQRPQRPHRQRALRASVIEQSRASHRGVIARKTNRRTSAHQAQPRPSRQDSMRHHKSPFSRDAANLRDGIATFDAVRSFPLLPRLPRFRVVSAGPADQRSAILETIIFRMRYPTTPNFGFFSVDAVRSLSLFNASIYRPYRFGPYIHADHEFLNSLDFGVRERLLPPIHQNQWY